MTKGELRREIQSRLRRIAREDLSARSRRVAIRLQAEAAWKTADSILCFLSMPHEIETAAIIEAAVRDHGAAAVPRIEGERIRFVLLPSGEPDLERDRFGIPVPGPDWPQWDSDGAGRILVVTPGLAFDRDGNRLGRGKGYYDRFLQECRARVGDRLVALGVCFEEQLVEAVPHTERDQTVDGVVTEARTVAAARDSPRP
ncbi:MAG TPA: 5-formyltetrahydrofolate cyclo-ligase [Spirochaetia bacterium]|nr:5-formyltetrahydrofolate cyclo-ligase [Spirochaetia bacterium]